MTCKGASQARSKCTPRFSTPDPKSQHTPGQVWLSLRMEGPGGRIRMCSRHFCSQAPSRAAASFSLLPSRTTPLLDRPRTVCVMER